MKIGRAIAWMTIPVWAGTIGWAADKERDLDVISFPVYSNFSTPFDVWAVAVRNPGDDTSGMLYVKRGAFQSTLAVNVPHETDIRGSKPILVAFPNANEIFGPEAILRLVARDGRSATLRVPERRAFATDTAQAPADQLFIDEGPWNSSKNLLFGREAKVRTAPEMASAYLSFDAVTLGPGTAQLSDAAVEALKNYVVAGGNLVFAADQPNSALDDPRWKDYLPATVEGGPKKIETDLKILGAQGPDQDLVKKGTLAEAEVFRIHVNPRSRPLFWFWKTGNRPHFPQAFAMCGAQKRFGVGSVILASFRPSSNFFQSLNGVFTGIKPHFLDAFNSSNNGTNLILAVPQRSTSMPTAASSSQSPSSDPFQAKPPSLIRIVLTLLGYAVAVIGSAALGQRIFKKGEIAWITTPILSLGFAGFFFSFASDLYRAKDSRTVCALIVGDATTGRGYAFGATQIFLRKGGKRDFKAEGIEYLVPNLETRDYMNAQGMSEAAFASLNLYQRPDSFVAPAVDVNNLDFLSYRFEQRLTIKDWFSADVHITKKGETHFANGVFRNNSPYALTGVAITVGTQQFLVNDAPPQSTIKIHQAPCTNFGGPCDIAQIPDFTQTDRMGLEASLQGFAPGPQIGGVSPEHANVKLAIDLGVGEVEP